MEIREIKLYECKIDTDFKLNKDGFYDTVAKAKIGELDNIIFLEISKKHFEYISQFDYKNTTFNIKGHLQVRKNKKEIPFIYFKSNFIVSSNEANNIKKQNKALLKKIRNNKKNDKTNDKSFNWQERLQNLGYKSIELDTKDIVLKDKEHFKNTNVDFSVKYLKKTLVVAVKEIDNSGKYELILGWKALIGARIFNKKVNAYIVDINRKDLLEKLES